MGAVEVRRPVSRAQIQRIVSVEEQAHSALFIQRVRIGIGETDLQPVTHALFDVSLQGVVRGNASRFVGFRFRRVTNVGNAQVDVAAFISREIRLAVGQVVES